MKQRRCWRLVPLRAFNGVFDGFAAMKGSNITARRSHLYSALGRAR
jgi:hypothetical protein